MPAAGSPPERAPVAKRPVLGVASVSTAVVVWGISSVFVKSVDANGLVVGFHRLWIGAAITCAAFMLTGGRITRRLLRLSLPGGLWFSVDIVLFFSALRATSVANATVIGALQPVLVLAVSARLFGERARLGDAAWGLVAIGGAAVVVLGGATGGPSSFWGDLLAVGALVSWTGYFVASKQARVHLTSFEYLTGLTLVAAVALAPFPLLFGQPLGVGGGASDWALIVFIACVNGALGHYFLNWAHPHVPLVIVSLLTLGIPVVATATAALLIGEAVTPLQAAGMAIVLGALSVVVRRTSAPGVPQLRRFQQQLRRARERRTVSQPPGAP